jgi:peptidoglycan/LPS O-acetylase OafA/YrhL
VPEIGHRVRQVRMLGPVAEASTLAQSPCGAMSYGQLVASRDHYRGLDLIRLFAALTVAWYHTAYWGRFFPDRTTAHVLAGRLVSGRLLPQRDGLGGHPVFCVRSGS